MPTVEGLDDEDMREKMGGIELEKKWKVQDVEMEMVDLELRDLLETEEEWVRKMKRKMQSLDIEE